ncbi:MAG: glutamate--cysteine ligase [Spiribacter sp.]|jgi:glutamate--cysteine ligase|nr:glutamate--cysteine ligase [Spiribacter sp.]MDR9489684.1 glutamate--cysteine ligase [Spiribacter sp.]
MNQSSDRRVRSLQQSGARGLLGGSRYGLEKESLRVTPRGHIAQSPHPAALGSALCHPEITTDYSEALLEFVTPALVDANQAIERLFDLHRFTYAHIGDELLWATSMPCIVGGERNIPIAEYGPSNIGQMKHIYRHGLDWRYGRAMQAIAGIHFNYSLSESFLRAVQAHEQDQRSFIAFRSDFYFRLIRNFQRYGWLIPYLMGASPAICKSFTGGKNLGFETFSEHTFYTPYATSLRMSDIGYKNNAQAALNISYNDVDSYVASLQAAIRTPDPEYSRIGTRVGDEWRQLNANILQIENEYYSFVRPKAAAYSGEPPTCALHRAGVEYVEIRALDLDPFSPVGINQEQTAFLETLLVFCLLEDSPPIDALEQTHINANQGLVAREGRDPSLTLYRGDGERVALRDWAYELFHAMKGPAELLDEITQGHRYRDTLAQYRNRVSDANQTPSAQILKEMRDRNEEFVEFALRLSKTHAQALRGESQDPAANARLRQAARRSIAEQNRLEKADELAFETFLAQYFAQEPTSGS